MNTTFETGATSHEVNNLVLYTQQTRELVAARDRLFKNLASITDFKKIGSANEKMLRRLSGHFDGLFWQARLSYLKEFKEEGTCNSITRRQCQEYRLIYLGYFIDWQKENSDALVSN